MSKEKTDPKVDAIVKVAGGTDVLELADTRRQAVELVAFLREARCETPEEIQWFSEQRAALGELKKKFDGERMKVKRPMLDAGTAVDKLFKPTLDPLKEGEEICLEKLKGAQQRRLDAEREVARLAAAATRPQDVIVALASAPEAVKTEGSSAGWAYEAVVVDADAVPRGWLVVDLHGLTELGRAAKAAGEEPSVPGIEFRKVATVRRRG